MPKVLLFSNVINWEFQHAQTVELAWEIHSSGSQVVLLRCNADLSSCPANPRHLLKRCASCILQMEYSKKDLPPGTLYESLKLEDHRGEFQFSQIGSQAEFQSLTFDGVPIGNLVLSQLTDDQSDLTIALEKLNSEGLQHANNGVALYRASLALIKKHEIDEVFVWNGRRISDGPVLYAARKMNLRATAFISGSSPEKYFTQANSIHSISEWKQSISNFHNQSSSDMDFVSEARDFFHELRFGTSPTIGYEWFARNSTEDISQRDDDQNQKKSLVIFTTSQWEVSNYLERVDLSEDFLDTYTLIKRICSSSKILANYSISVRWHPNLRRAGSNERKMINDVIISSSQATHFHPESLVDSYKLMEEASVVLTTGSTMGIEAAYAGKASILAGLAFYSGLSVYEPSDFSELENLLTTELVPLSPDGAIRYGSFMRNFGKFYRFVSWNQENRAYTFQSRDLSFRSNRFNIRTILNFSRIYSFLALSSLRQKFEK